jgi:hypothetical protein
VRRFYRTGDAIQADTENADERAGLVGAWVKTLPIEGGSAAIVEVDLNKPLHWQSLGDFKAQIQRHRPDRTGTGRIAADGSGRPDR